MQRKSSQERWGGCTFIAEDSSRLSQEEETFQRIEEICVLEPVTQE